MATLSAEQIKLYHDEGYLIVDGFLTEEECDTLRARCRVLVDENDFSNHPTVVFNTRESPQFTSEYFNASSDKIRFFFEEGALGDDGKMTVPVHEALNKIGHALHALDPEFKKITFSKKVEGIARSLQMDHPAIAQSMYIFKQPRFGGAVRPHNDTTFLDTTPMTLVGFWIALEDADIENSCLWFVPKSHKNHVNVGSSKNSTDGPHSAVGCDDFVAGPVKKGSLVLIDGRVLHKSEENTSNRSRHIYTFHMYDAGKSKWSKENWLQPSENLPFPTLY